jgi:hypothetical protein
MLSGSVCRRAPQSHDGAVKTVVPRFGEVQGFSNAKHAHGASAEAIETQNMLSYLIGLPFCAKRYNLANLAATSPVTVSQLSQPQTGIQFANRLGLQ